MIVSQEEFNAWLESHPDAVESREDYAQVTIRKYTAADGTAKYYNIAAR
jgi:hypothetical protein